jgi:hypothetical protein
MNAAEEERLKRFARIVNDTAWYPTEKKLYEIDVPNNDELYNSYHPVGIELWKGFTKAKNDAWDRDCIFAAWVVVWMPKGSIITRHDRDFDERPFDGTDRHTWGDHIKYGIQINRALWDKRGAIFLSEYGRLDDTRPIIAEYARVTLADDKILLEIKKTERIAIYPSFLDAVGQKYGRTIDTAVEQAAGRQ